MTGLGALSLFGTDSDPSLLGPRCLFRVIFASTPSRFPYPSTSISCILRENRLLAVHTLAPGSTPNGELSTKFPTNSLKLGGSMKVVRVSIFEPAYRCLISLHPDIVRNHFQHHDLVVLQPEILLHHGTRSTQFPRYIPRNEFIRD